MTKKHIFFKVNFKFNRILIRDLVKIQYDNKNFERCNKYFRFPQHHR